MIIFNVLTILIGVATIVGNIWIARYNVGKNRTVYEVETLSIGGIKTMEDINKKLNKGNYTILQVGQDLRNCNKVQYTLGRVK